jgi:hypothetical protein
MAEDNQVTNAEMAKANAKPEAPETSSNAPATPRYNAERRHNDWRTGPGRLGRALIHELMLAKKLSQRGLLTAFVRLWPTCQNYFAHPLTPHQLYSRWWTGVRPGYENEHPDKNAETKKYRPYAKAIVAADVPITDADVDRIVTEVAAANPTDGASDDQCAA